MSKRARKEVREDLEFSTGESVLGFHGGWPYPATIENIFPYFRLSDDAQKLEPGNFFLLRWTGFSGKKALGLVRSAQISKNDSVSTERRRALESARKDGDLEILEKLYLETPQLNSAIRAPPEIFHKQEFSVVSEAFEFPAKLRIRLVEQEERIVAQEPPAKSSISVSQILADWLKANATLGTWKYQVGEAKEFSKSLITAFNRLALTSLLYSFELPARISRAAPADFLGPDELLRLLSLFPEISSAITHSLTGNQFPKILSLVKGFNCLCDFLCKNYKTYFPVSDSEDAAGIYYLPKDAAASPAPRVFPAGKRKQANHLVKRIQ